MNGSGGPAVVLGVGNVLLGDDGAGVRVVEALRSMAVADPSALSEATRLVDGGTLGLELLDELDGARSLVVVDAMDLGQPAGTVAVLRDGAILGAAARNGGLVTGGVGELLAAARLVGVLPGAVALVGIQVDSASLGRTMSERVAAGLPAAVRSVVDTLRELDRLTGGSPRGPHPTTTAARAGEPAGAAA